MNKIMCSSLIDFNLPSETSGLSYTSSKLAINLMALLILLSSLQAQDISNNTINIVISVPFSKPYIFRKELIQPAVELALASVRSNTPPSLRDYTFDVTFRNSNCSRRAAVSVVEFYYDHCRRNPETNQFSLTSPLLFLGPVCNEATATVAAFAEKWNVPVISTGSHAVWISTGESNSTLTRITPSYDDLAFFIHQAFETEDIEERTVVHLVYEDVFHGVGTERDCLYMMQAINFIFSYYKSTYETEAHAIRQEEFDADEFVQDIGNPKAVLICASSDKVREIMLSAWHAGYAVPGLNNWYVVELHNDTHYAHGAWKKGDVHDSFAKAAYRSLQVFTLRVSTTDEFLDFKESMEEYYNNAGIDGSVNAYIEGFHDAIVLYVRGLVETQKQGKSLLDGRAVTSNMKNLTFKGIAGLVTIDALGDRRGDYSLLSMKNFKNGRFEKILDYFGKPNRITLYKIPSKQPKLPEWMVGKDYDQNGYNSLPKEPNDFDYKAIAGVFGTMVGIVMCCLLIAAPICYKRRSSSRSSDSAANIQQDLHVPLREEESVTTCVSWTGQED